MAVGSALLQALAHARASTNGQSSPVKARAAPAQDGWDQALAPATASGPPVCSPGTWVGEQGGSRDGDGPGHREALGPSVCAQSWVLDHGEALGPVCSAQSWGPGPWEALGPVCSAQSWGPSFALGAACPAPRAGNMESLSPQGTCVPTELSLPSALVALLQRRCSWVSGSTVTE